MFQTTSDPAEPAPQLSPVDNRLWRVLGDPVEPDGAPALLGFIERTPDAYRSIGPGHPGSCRESLEQARADFLVMP